MRLPGLPKTWAALRRRWYWLLPLAALAWWFHLQTLPYFTLKERVLTGLARLFPLALLALVWLAWRTARLADGRAQARPAAWLIVLREQGLPDASLRLVSGLVTIGREPGQSFRPAASLVSRRHCVLQAEGTRLLLSDTGSANGTYLNGRPLQGQAQLKHGDQVALGGKESPALLLITWES